MESIAVILLYPASSATCSHAAALRIWDTRDSAQPRHTGHTYTQGCTHTHTDTHTHTQEQDVNYHLPNLQGMSFYHCGAFDLCVR